MVQSKLRTEEADSTTAATAQEITIDAPVETEVTEVGEEAATTMDEDAGEDTAGGSYDPRLIQTTSVELPGRSDIEPTRKLAIQIFEVDDLQRGQSHKTAL